MPATTKKAEPSKAAKSEPEVEGHKDPSSDREHTVCPTCRGEGIVETITPEMEVRYDECPSCLGLGVVNRDASVPVKVSTVDEIAKVASAHRVSLQYKLTKPYIGMFVQVVHPNADKLTAGIVTDVWRGDSIHRDEFPYICAVDTFPGPQHRVLQPSDTQMLPFIPNSGVVALPEDGPWCRVPPESGR